MEGCTLSVSISKTAKILGKAKVLGDAKVYGQSILKGDVTISSGWIKDVSWWREIP